MEKTPLELALDAFAEPMQVIDEALSDSLLSFEEFTGHGLRHDLQAAGEALARAEHYVRLGQFMLRELLPGRIDP